MPLQKLLFSATLTQNPEKLQQLGLHQPRLFSSIHSHSNTTLAAPNQKQDRFDFPQSLTVRDDLWPSGRSACTGGVAGCLDNDSIFVFLGVLRALYVKQKAAPHPPLHPEDEAQPHPLLHQLQRDCTQVGEHHTSWACFFHVFYQGRLFQLFSFLLRLHLLVQLFGGIQAAEFSSRLSPGERKKTLKEFEQGKIQLWVHFSAAVELK